MRPSRASLDASGLRGCVKGRPRPPGDACYRPEPDMQRNLYGPSPHFPRPYYMKDKTSAQVTFFARTADTARRSLFGHQGVGTINGSSCLDVSSQTWPRASGVFLYLQRSAGRQQTMVAGGRSFFVMASNGERANVLVDRINPMAIEGTEDA
jgi:hypothetical protein